MVVAIAILLVAGPYRPWVASSIPLLSIGWDAHRPFIFISFFLVWLRMITHQVNRRLCCTSASLISWEQHGSVQAVHTDFSVRSLRCPRFVSCRRCVLTSHSSPWLPTDPRTDGRTDQLALLKVVGIIRPKRRRQRRHSTAAMRTHARTRRSSL